VLKKVTSLCRYEINYWSFGLGNYFAGCEIMGTKRGYREVFGGVLQSFVEWKWEVFSTFQYCKSATVSLASEELGRKYLK